MQRAKGWSLSRFVSSFSHSTGGYVMHLRHLMTNLIIELYKYQAESERKRIIERQQQGIALAKQQGKYHSRKPQYTQDDPRLQHAFKLYQGGMSDVDVARNTGIKRTTFIRYRKKYKIKRK